jgi:hypothetical protein
MLSLQVLVVLGRLLAEELWLEVFGRGDGSVLRLVSRDLDQGLVTLGLLLVDAFD